MSEWWAELTAEEQEFYLAGIAEFLPDDWAHGHKTFERCIFACEPNPASWCRCSRSRGSWPCHQRLTGPDLLCTWCREHCDLISAVANYWWEQDQAGG